MKAALIDQSSILLNIYISGVFDNTTNRFCNKQSNTFHQYVCFLLNLLKHIFDLYKMERKQHFNFNLSISNVKGT